MNKVAYPLPGWSPEDWKTAGNIAVHCRGRVLLMGGCVGMIPPLISSFGYEFYGIGNENEVSAARQNAYKLGLMPRFAVQDIYSPIPLTEKLFDTVVIGVAISHAPAFLSVLKEACRIVNDGGRVIFILNGKNPSKNIFLTDIPLNIHFKIPQKNSQFIIVASKKQNSEWSVISEKKYKKIEDFFLPSIPLDELNISSRVTVIIPTFNRSRYLVDAIESVILQTYKNIEVVVINDGSTDDTDEAVKPYLDKIVYVHKENGGKSSALNLAIEKATGDYIWYLDDDDIALPKKLELQMRYLQRHPEVGILFTGGLRFKDADSRQIIFVRRTPDVNKDNLLVRFLDDCIVVGQSALVRKVCYEKAGSFRTDLVRSQDHEMWIRMARAFKIGFLDFPTVLLREHEGIRGSAGMNISPKDHDIQGLKYGNIFFPDIYKSLSLDEIVPALKKNSDDISLRVQAYCEKGLIAALYLHRDYAISDLREARALAKDKNISVSLECFDKVIIIVKRLIMPAFKKLDTVFVELLRLIGALSNKARIADYLARRCYWKGIESFRYREYFAGVKWFFYAFRFIVIRYI